MTAQHDKGPLLGRQVSGSEVYDPSLLFPVPRAHARGALAAPGFSGFGEDLWQCYELSWLDDDGVPQSYLGWLSVPADSPNLVESKSLKLYLNSLNQHRFSAPAQAQACIEQDLAAVVAAPVSLSLHAVEDTAFQPQPLPGIGLDGRRVAPAPHPDRSLLCAASEGELQAFTHNLRSLCPVTAQPDWATVLVHLRGELPEQGQLLAYLLAFRGHQEFHEQCVERIFSDLSAALRLDFLSVQALYTRRGGLAICPWRCSDRLPAPRLRMHRQ